MNNFIKEKLNQVKKNGADEVVLHGDHLEGAVLLIKGDWGVFPQYRLDTDHGTHTVQVFVYHSSLVDERNRLLAKKLIENKAVKLYKGCDEVWLYDALSDMSEEHLMETARRLAKGLAIYSVEFNEEGDYELKEMGVV